MHTGVGVSVGVHMHAREWGCERGKGAKGSEQATRANHLCLVPWEKLPCSQALLSWLAWDPPNAKLAGAHRLWSCDPQSLRTAPGSSLVSVCQRSIFLSLFFRQSNQCLSRSPLALIPNTTPPMKSLDFPIS